MTVLQNYVILEEGVPARMHFVDHRVIRRDITDPLTGGPGSRNALDLTVDRLDGLPVQSTFSTLSEKLASQLEPYLDGRKYTAYDFIITKIGTGFRTVFQVQVVPR